MKDDYYRILIQLLPDIVYKIDRNGRFIYLNKAVENIGYTPEELLGRHFSEIIHPDDAKSVQRDLVLRQIKSDGAPKEQSVKLFDERRTGKRITTKLKLALVPKNRDPEAVARERSENLWEVISLGHYGTVDEGLEYTGSIGILRDIRNVSKTEEILQRNIRHYESLIENSSEIINILAHDGTILYSSSSSRTVLGYEALDLIGKNIFDYIVVDDYTRMLRELKPENSPVDRPLFQTDIRLMNKKGVPLMFEVSGKRIYDNSGELMCYILNSRDITEKNRMIEELIHAKRIESIRILAGGIAHDFNNLLTSIIGNISIALLNAGEDDVNYRLLQDAERASLRARDLTKQLLSFSKGSAPIKKVASLKNLLRETSLFVLSGSHVMADFDIAGDLMNAYCDEGQISQIVHNLLLNSIQAMDDAGVVDIKAHNVEVTQAMGLPLDEGSYIVISVKDRGRGIGKDVLSKIFDPFFTTRKEGTGLGLSVTQAIVEKHKGHIEVDSEEGAGTEFRIYLPGSREEITGAAERPEKKRIDGARILLMDDDEMILEICEKMLKQMNCSVVKSKNGNEAVRLYKEAKGSGKPFDAVILDLTIPGGMGGREVIKILKEFDPKVKAIVSSGYSTDKIMSEYREYGFSGVTPKPYNINELEDILCQVLCG